VKVALFGAVLVLWGNLLQRLIGPTAVLPGGSWQFVAAGVVLVAVSLLAARLLALDIADLGLRREGAVRGVVIGAVAGAAMAAISVAVLRLAPAIIGMPIVYGPLLTVSDDQLVQHIALFLPLGAVIPEEVSFRGTLLAALARGMGVRAGVAASALTFAAWHMFVAVTTIYDTSLGQVAELWVAASIGALLVLFVGGVIMAALRLVTASLSTAIAAHWIFNAFILVGLWADRTVATPAT
jgi:membrane protease YdiL (CAAX protease family)